MYTNTRPESHVSTATLPAGHYTDPAYFARELEAIHFKMWLFAGRTDELPKPGSFVTRSFANANVLIVRDEDGKVRAHHNVCRHRGTLLVHEESGHLGSTVQCKYHAWTYKLDGTLRKAPHMEKVAGFCEKDYPLVSVHVAEWDGLIFVNFSPVPPPFAEHLNGLDTRFKNWRMTELKTVAKKTYQLQANWKLIIQNYHECIHCPIAHPLLTKITPYMSGDNEPPQPTWLGSSMDLLPGMKTLSMTPATSPRRPLPHLTEDETRHIYYYAVLPNMLINFHPDYVLTFMFNPVAVDRTDITCTWLMHPQDAELPGFDPSDAVEFWDITNKQDWELSDLAQRGIGSLGYRSGPFSNREEMLMALDRWTMERVGPL